MKTPKPKLLIAFLAFINAALASCSVFSQTARVVPSQAKNNTYTDIDAYAVFLKKTTAQYSNTIDKKLQKEYIDIIDKKNADVIKEFGDKHFLFDDQVYPYLHALFNYILQKNSLDENRFHFFVNRTNDINAYSYEDGTIVCNLGLLNIMNNESQLAMVFCHELGHYLLGHVNASIISQLQTYHSPAFLAQVKKIKKQEFDTKRQLETLFKNDVFDKRRHNRWQENSADSLGRVLFRNTGYDGTQVSHIFDLLAAAEQTGTTGLLRNFFKQETIKVDDSWLQPNQKMSFGTLNKAVADSLKTHPDCMVRKALMDANFAKNPKPGIDFIIADAGKLALVKKTALFAEADFAKESDNLSYYFYQLIQNSSLYPADNYIKSEIFNTLVSLCRHQKNHTFHTVVSSQYIPEDDQDEYAILLKVFDNADLDTLAGMANQYYNNHKSSINTSAEVINNLKQFKN